MTDAIEIDWSKAPEGAGHYCKVNERWYRANGVDGMADIFNRGGEWVESLFTTKELRFDIFIPRPLQQTAQVSVQMNNPPIGLTPKNVFIEWMQTQRQKDIKEAMLRYIEAGKDIPNEWLQEMIELNNTIQNVQPEAVKEDKHTSVDVGEWIEWGKNGEPSGLSGKIIERRYIDGQYMTGRADEFTWNTHSSCIDGDTVSHYRTIGEEE